MSLALRYAIFAAFSTAINLLVQAAVLEQFGDRRDVLYAAMAVGTIAGLYAKYVLDKRYIFAYRTRNASHDIRTFFLYAGTGAFTTTIFWGFELGFYYAFDTHVWRNIGAIIGLTIGYLAKYWLDRRFAFAVEAVSTAN